MDQQTNVNIVPIKIDTTKVHLMGLRHGLEYGGHTISGLTSEERQAVSAYIKSTNISPDNTCILFEGQTPKAFGRWQRASSVSTEKFPYKITMESSNTLRTTWKDIAKINRFFWQDFKTWKPKTKAMVLSLAPIVITLGGTALVLIGVSNKLSRKRVEKKVNALNISFEKYLNSGNTIIDHHCLFRDFVHASIVRLVSDVAGPQNIMVFQGSDHTPGTKRFLSDKKYYEKYRRRLVLLAPKANKIFLGNLRKKTRDLRRLIRHSKH